MMMLIAGYQFGAIVYNEEYNETKQSKDFIANKLSIMFMISTVSAFPVSSLYGVLCDRLKVWKLLLFNCLIVLLANCTFVYGTISLKDDLPLPAK